MPQSEDQAKTEAKIRQAHKVQDKFIWLQCFALYTSIWAPEHPELIPELMVYQSTIIRASQDYAGLA